MLIKKLLFFLLLLLFLAQPLEAVFAFDENSCSCQAFSINELSSDDEVLISAYLFANEQGDILAITPLSENFFLWAYSSPDFFSDFDIQVSDFMGVFTLYRLTSASTTNASTSPDYLQAWGYNALGNMATSSTLGTYSYGSTNYANPHAATSIGTSTITSLYYDNNGNLASTTRGSTTWRYGWDYRNEMTSAASGTATTTYGYDYMGNRVSMRSSGSASTTFVNKYFDVQGATTTKHIYANGEIIATVVGTGNSTSSYIVHTDHLGGVHVTTNASGTVQLTNDYFPYGDVRLSSGSITESRGFIGERYDASTHLNYLNARYYQNGRGTFLSQDPEFRENIESYLDDPQQMNSYSYARNNPIIAKDPSGRAAVAVLAAPALKGLLVAISALLATLGTINASSPQSQSAFNQFANSVGQFVQSVNNFVSSSIKAQSGAVTGTINATITNGSQTAVSTPATNIPGLSIPSYSDRGTGLLLQNTAGSKGGSLPAPGQLTGKSAEEVDHLMKERGLKGEHSRGGGTRYPVPGRPGDQVRIENGNPNNSDPVKRGPYGRVSENGKTSDPFPLRGNPLLR